MITNPEFLLLFAPPDVPLTDYSSFGKINVRVLSPLKPIALVALECRVLSVYTAFSCPIWSTVFVRTCLIGVYPVHTHACI